jgi:hypothetical protein
MQYVCIEDYFAWFAFAIPRVLVAPPKILYMIASRATAEGLLYSVTGLTAMGVQLNMHVSYLT